MTMSKDEIAVIIRDFMHEECNCPTCFDAVVDGLAEELYDRINGIETSEDEEENVS
jgi:hypothetical protein